MKYGDFSSIVQLGVGLHLGTALLQIYGEIGLQPLIRSIARIRSLFLAPEHERPSKATEEAVDQLESKYEIFRIQLFNEFKKYILINSGIAIFLAMALVIIALFADVEIADGMEWTVVLMVSLSLAPAPITLGRLWWDARQRVKPMKEEADKIEKQALAGK